MRESLLARRFSAAELAAEALRFAEAENPEHQRLSALFAGTRDGGGASEWMSGSRAARIRARWPACPIAVKDVIVTGACAPPAGRGCSTNYVPPYDATAIVRIEAAGGVILGKTNCDEFAMGSSNENSAFGPVRNPVAPDRVPGGSSGGSAAVVAQGTAVVSLGRIPAARCGSRRRSAAWWG